MGTARSRARQGATVARARARSGTVRQHWQRGARGPMSGSTAASAGERPETMRLGATMSMSPPTSSTTPTSASAAGVAGERLHTIDRSGMRRG